MADKKIKVTDFSADESLTPEEEHAIEVKVDKLLDPQQPAQAAPEFPGPKPAAKIIVLDDETADTSPDAAAALSAPPLPKRGKRRAAASDKTAGKAAAPRDDGEALPVELVPETLPTDAMDIDLATADGPTVPVAEDTGEQPAATSPDEAATDQEPAVKKYRPPDGPLPFKRAQPPPETAAAKQSAADAAELDAIDDAPPPPPKPQPQKGRRKGRRLIPVLLLILLLIAFGGIARLRAIALAAARIHGSVDISVVDSKSHVPLANVTVQAGSTTTTTDAQGRAVLKGLHMGSQDITLRKAAFSPVTKPIVLAWKSTDLGEVALQQTGTIYSFKTKDYVSDKPVATAQVSDGQSVSHADTQGLVSLGVDAHTTVRSVTISAPGYRTTTVSLPSQAGAVMTVTLVPSTPDIYMAKHDGIYNVYQIGVDGKNNSLLLAGTGREVGDDLSLVTNPDGSWTALVATRDNQRDKAGYLLDTLLLIDTRTKATITVDHAEQLKIVGWFGNRLVYTSLKADAAADDPARYSLQTYNMTTKKISQLDHANTFNDVATAEGVIYYAISDGAIGGSAGLFRINPDGSGKQTLLSTPIASIVRPDYDDLLFSGATRYAYRLGTQAKPTATTATTSTGRLYVTSPDGRHSVWIDTDAHKLVLYNTATKAETTLTQQNGLSYPVRWLNAGTLIYRMTVGGVSMDNVISLAGGSPKQVVTVSDATGISAWKD